MRSRPWTWRRSLATTAALSAFFFSLLFAWAILWLTLYEQRAESIVRKSALELQQRRVFQDYTAATLNESKGDSPVERDAFAYFESDDFASYVQKANDHLQELDARNSTESVSNDAFGLNDAAHRRIHRFCNDSAEYWPIAINDSMVRRLIAIAESLASLLEVEYRLGLRMGDSHRMQQAIESELGLCQLIRGSAQMSLMDTCFSLQRSASKHLRFSLENNLLDVQALRTFIVKLGPNQTYAEHWQSTIELERVIGISELAHPSRRRATIAEWPFPASRWDVVHLLETFSQLEQVPMDRFEESIVAVSQILGNVDTHRNGASRLMRREWLETQERTRLFSSYIWKQWRSEIARQQDVAGLAVRYYQKQHGNFPRDFQAAEEFEPRLRGIGKIKGLPIGYLIDPEGHAVVWGPVWARQMPLSMPTLYSVYPAMHATMASDVGNFEEAIITLLP